MDSSLVTAASRTATPIGQHDDTLDLFLYLRYRHPNLALDVAHRDLRPKLCVNIAACRYVDVLRPSVAPARPTPLASPKLPLPRYDIDHPVAVTSASVTDSVCYRSVTAASRLKHSDVFLYLCHRHPTVALERIANAVRYAPHPALATHRSGRAEAQRDRCSARARR